MNQRSKKRSVTKLRNYSCPDERPLLPPAVVIEKNQVQFVPSLAHEVRNPLANINLAVEMLQSMIADDEQKLYLDIVLRASARINELVSDLLLHHNQTLVQPVKCSVQQLLNEVLFLTADRLMLKNICIIKEYTLTECNVMVDKQNIKMALTNIIINAIDAMATENGELKLSINLVNNKCIMEIEDNGVGISMDNLQHIFKPYFTNKISGMGLVLSTTMETLLANQVKVAVQSEEGIGTRFILSFKSVTPRKQLEVPVLMVV